MTQPEMDYVDSTNIEAIGYDAEFRELHILFRSGKTYIYSDISEDIHHELLYADSKGSYLNREIKPNYECREG